MRVLLAVLTFLWAGMLLSEDTVFVNYDQSALCPAKDQIRYSLFAKGEYGISDKITLRVHPILFFVAPSIDIKYNFYENDNIIISSVHSITYPTLLLYLIKNKGTGGIISPEFEIPHMFSIANGLVTTYKLSDYHWISGSVSLAFALNNNRLEPGTSIDLPVILPRTMVYYKNLGLFVNFISEGKVSSVFDYHLASELSLFPLEDDEFDYEYQESSNNIFWELTGTGFIKFSKTFKLGVGGILCYGTYPFGSQWHLLPCIDFVKIIE